jgi:hypothetical protein
MREQSRDSQGGKPSLRNIGSIGAAHIQHYLKDIEYPADKEQLLERARLEDAPQDVLDCIEQFPDLTYNSPVHVAQMLDRVQF